MEAILKLIRNRLARRLKRRTFLVKRLMLLSARALKRRYAKEKRRRRYANSDSYSDSSEEIHTINALENSVKSYLHSLSLKRQKTQNHCAEVVGCASLGHDSPKVMRKLVDTGSTSTIILRRFCDPQFTSRFKGKPLKWRTLGGVFSTQRKALMKFQLPEFSTKSNSMEVSC
ncbi:MAG: hypothetical protein ACREOZ_01205 [Gloeomargaritales cyanobacterium]